MENDIKFIQNTIWSMYKEYQSTHDMKMYNQQAEKLCRKYEGQPILGSFCANLIISWAPVINKMAEEYRKESA